MRNKKLISGILAGVMTVAMSYTAAIAEESDIVYTYTDENGETVNITQTQLDTEHWNKDALGDDLPMIYESFPAKVEGYVNDFGEVSLDIQYMKKDMDNVTVALLDVDSDEIVYNNEEAESYISTPALNEEHRYQLHLSETLNGKTTDFDRGVSIERSESPINGYLQSENVSDEHDILICDVDKLRQGETIDSNGQMVIDSSIAKYAGIAADEFLEYAVNNLAQGKTYRVYTIIDDEICAGFVDGNEPSVIYSPEVNTYDLINLCTDTTLITECDNLDFDDAKDSAEDIDLTDASFKISNPRTVSAAYRAYKLSIPASAITKSVEESIDSDFRVKISGNAQMKVRYQFIKNSLTVLEEKTKVTSNSTNSFSFSFYTGNMELTSSSDYVDIYFMIYFPQTVSGVGMINCYPNEGYEDDVTGSVYAAYTSSSVTDNLDCTEYTMTDSWDVDSFRIGTDASNGVYKVELKNRSVADETALNNGESARGSAPKYITGYTMSGSGSSTTFSEYEVYTVPRNQNVVFYRVANDSPEVISIRNVSGGLTTANSYQLSYSFTAQN